MQANIRNADKSLNKKKLAYEFIRDRIIRNDYRPLDSITEQSICQELEISKTPVREALKELEKDGFVKVLPGKGCLVSGITLDYIREIFEIREIIECAAVRSAAKQGDKQFFQALLEGHVSFELAQKNNIKDSLVSGYEIHTVIVESLGNSRLLEFYNNIQSHIIRIRLFFLHQFDMKRLEEMSSEHKAILKAIISADADGAEEAMRKHLRNSQERIKSLL